MVRNLEQVEVGQASGDERRIDVLFDVASEEEPLAVAHPEQHDGGVVDRLAVAERGRRHRAGVGPEDREPDRIQGEAVPADKASGRRPAPREGRCPGGGARAASRQAGLVDQTDPIPGQHHRQARHVVLVGMREHDDVEAAIPWREALVERPEEPVGTWPAIDDHATTPVAFDEDGVALPDVENGHANRPVRAVGDGQAERNRRAGERQAGEASAARASTPDPLPRPRRYAVVVCLSAGRQVRSHSGQPGLAPPGDGHDEQQRGAGRDDIPWGGERQARHRQAGACSNDRDHRRVDGPGRQPDQRRHGRGCSKADEHAGRQRDRAQRHRRRHERDHEQVHGRRDQRQAPEVQQDHRRGRRLRCE